MAPEDPGDFAVVLYREEGRWVGGLLPDRLLEDLDGMLAALRQQPGDGGAVALVDVAEEVFLVLRVFGGEERILLSDVTAAVAFELAAQVCERLDVDIPGEDDLDDAWPVGDLSLLSDLGVDEMEVGALIGSGTYPDEQLRALARRAGFADVYERVVESGVR